MVKNSVLRRSMVKPSSKTRKVSKKIEVSDESLQNSQMCSVSISEASACSMNSVQEGLLSEVLKEKLELQTSELFLNREIEWLRFNERVLGEAENPQNPLMERLKFLAIFDSNLDEFFMVRLSRLLRLLENPQATAKQVSVGEIEDPEETFDEVSEKIRELLRRHVDCLHNKVLPELASHGIHLINYKALRDEEKKEMRAYFESQIFPILTPLAVDPAHPFPYLSNLSLYLAVEFEETDELGNKLLGFVEIPRSLQRFVPVRTSVRESKNTFIPIEDLVRAYVDSLFPWTRVSTASVFRVTRNYDYQLLETEVTDLMKSMEYELKDRAQKIAVRLEVEPHTPESVKTRLKQALDLDSSDTYAIYPLLALRDAWQLVNLEVDPKLREAPFTPRNHPKLSENSDIFAALREGDIMLHHPYDSFSGVLEFLGQAVDDPNVLAIKQTLYRTGGDSPVTELLTKAAENGKQVTAVVELKARFDEKTNIEWARKLERSGVHVVFGFVGLKTHAKCTLVIRREAGELRRYAHLSTGNYNSSTAKVYTDIGFFTASPEITEDVANLFNLLTGFNILKNEDPKSIDVGGLFKKTAVAPFTLRKQLCKLIEREIAHAKAGKSGHIIIKVNSLIDHEFIELFYKASQAGVKIELIVRGMCSLRPGLPEISDNITVRSIVDRFLEHSRVYWFANAGASEVYLSSADIMARNMDRRIEIFWPVEAAHLKKELYNLLQAYLKDNIKAHIKQPDGTYIRLTPQENTPVFRVQEFFLRAKK